MLFFLLNIALLILFRLLLVLVFARLGHQRGLAFHSHLDLRSQFFFVLLFDLVDVVPSLVLDFFPLNLVFDGKLFTFGGQL